jgi:hypothetical protein
LIGGSLLNKKALIAIKEKMKAYNNEDNTDQVIKCLTEISAHKKAITEMDSSINEVKEAIDWSKKYC